MNTSEHILVILLSLALAVLLVLAIVIAIAVIKLVKVLNRLALKAENVAEKAENIGSLLSKATTSTAAFKMAKTIFKIVTKRNKQTKA